MATGYMSGLIDPTPAMPCAGARMRVPVWGLRATPRVGVGFGSRTAPIIRKGRAFNWHDTR